MLNLHYKIDLPQIPEQPGQLTVLTRSLLLFAAR